ncbi:hypothetical protein N7I30_13890 [Aurantimonas litoralis]|nr:hypothetical protein [Aurantimonas litoralis]
MAVKTTHRLPPYDEAHLQYTFDLIDWHIHQIPEGDPNCERPDMMAAMKVIAYYQGLYRRYHPNT